MNRFGWGFGVLRMDSDHFKNVNDIWGHPAGDAVLRVAARTLAHNARSFDLVGRWGGEDFLAVVSGVDESKLHTVASRFRALVEQSNLDYEADRISVTVSVGGAIAQAADTEESLLERAGQHLYQSKAPGQNRVTLEYPRVLK